MKIKNFILLIVTISLFLLSACGGRRKSVSVFGAGDTLSLSYAENLTLVEYPDYTVAILRNPWDTLCTLHTYILLSRDKEQPSSLPAGTVVRVPLQHSLVYSSVHCALLQDLGILSSVSGVCDLKYIRIGSLQQATSQGKVVDCGDSMNPDIERVIALSPDAILLSPFENSGGYGRIEKLNIPIIECADYMETSPLGRAEWMRFYGRLFGVSVQADSLFAQVENHYQQLMTQARSYPSSLSVISELKSGAAWYIPGGRSTIGRLYSDAGGRYAFATDTHSGSIPLTFEAVYDKASEADVWLIKYNSQADLTYRQLQADYAPYAGFKAFKDRNIYGCNTAVVPYYEETPFHPDWLLADFIYMFHPEAVSDSCQLRYFKKLTE